MRETRTRRGWSQEEVARRSGLSRAGVSAIETGRLVPSTTAALALAFAFGCKVEDLFWLDSREAPEGLEWAWESSGPPGRYWVAEVGGRPLAFPVESLATGSPIHDGLARLGRPQVPEGIDPRRSLVMASCDPAAGLLAELYERESGFRLLIFSRSSRQALDLLARGLVHVAGAHLARDDDPEGNRRAVREQVREAACLLRAGRWEEGLVVAPGIQARSVGAALRGRLSWVGREPGSGARRCLDQLGPGLPEPRHLARDHRGVAEAVRGGWAEAGVCLRLTGEEAGLRFFSVQFEPYDLCFSQGIEQDPRVQALVRVVRSARFRALIEDLPGYDATSAGELARTSE